MFFSAARLSSPFKGKGPSPAQARATALMNTGYTSPVARLGFSQRFTYGQSGYKHRQIEPVYAQPEEMATPGAGFLLSPFLAVPRLGKPRMIRNQMDFNTINLADLPFMNDALGFDHDRINAIAESQQKLALVGF